MISPPIHSIIWRAINLSYFFRGLPTPSFMWLSWLLFENLLELDMLGFNRKVFILSSSLNSYSWFTLVLIEECHKILTTSSPSNNKRGSHWEIMWCTSMPPYWRSATSMNPWPFWPWREDSKISDLLILSIKLSLGPILNFWSTHTSTFM